MSTTFHISGFSSDVTATELAYVLEQRIGLVCRVDIPPKARNGAPYAFIQFLEEYNKDHVISTSINVKGRILSITLSHKNNRNYQRHDHPTRSDRHMDHSYQPQRRNNNRQYHDMDYSEPTRIPQIVYDDPVPSTGSQNFCNPRGRSPIKRRIETPRPMSFSPVRRLRSPQTPPSGPRTPPPRSPSPLEESELIKETEPIKELSAPERARSASPSGSESGLSFTSSRSSRSSRSGSRSSSRSSCRSNSQCSQRSRSRSGSVDSRKSGNSFKNRTSRSVSRESRGSVASDIVMVDRE